MRIWPSALSFRSVLFSALLLIASMLQSQIVLRIQLKDHNNNPVPFALLRYQNTNVYADQGGLSILSQYKSGTKISIYRFGFADTSLFAAVPPDIKDTLHLNIILRQKLLNLPEVSVNFSLLREINPMKADFVMGYELKEDYLLELLTSGSVLVIDAQGNPVSRSHPFAGARDVVRDPFGDVYEVTEKSAHKLKAFNPAIKIDSIPGDLKNLNWNLTYCDEAIGNTLFVRRYKDNNQTLAFFAMPAQQPNRAILLKEISDAARKNAVAAFANETNSLNHYLERRGLSKVTASTSEELYLVRKAQKMSDALEMNYVLPAYSVIKLVNDSLYLFAHDLDSMFVYNKNCNLARSMRINYHHLKIWDREIIVNEEKTRVYARLKQDSKTMIAEIDLLTGSLKPNYFTLSSRFPTKIRIRNNVVYFMSRQKSGVGYTVYSQDLRASN